MPVFHILGNAFILNVFPGRPDMNRVLNCVKRIFTIRSLQN